jgi:uncharacterized membrane protein YfcA
VVVRRDDASARPAGVAGTSRLVLAFVGGASIGLLGGLVGLGGAEFRLPLLLLFGFAALAAVIINKAMSLVVVLVALPSRTGAVPLATLLDSWPVVAILLVGSLPGAWFGASWATRMRADTLHRVLGALLLGIAGVFAAHHFGLLPEPEMPAASQVALGIVAGFGCGVAAAFLGVAGGELYLPLITVLFGLDVKLSGSLTLLVSLPTMLIALARYSRSQAFAVLRLHARFVAAMTAGSVAGTVAGGLLLGAVPAAVIGPLVVVLLLASAVKVWRHA